MENDIYSTELIIIFFYNTNKGSMYNNIFNKMQYNDNQEDEKVDIKSIGDYIFSDIDVRKLSPERYKYYKDLIDIYEKNPKILYNVLRKYYRYDGLKIKEEQLLKTLKYYASQQQVNKDNKDNDNKVDKVNDNIDNKKLTKLLDKIVQFENDTQNTSSNDSDYDKLINDSTSIIEEKTKEVAEKKSEIEDIKAIIVKMNEEKEKEKQDKQKEIETLKEQIKTLVAADDKKTDEATKKEKQTLLDKLKTLVAADDKKTDDATKKEKQTLIEKLKTLEAKTDKIELEITEEKKKKKTRLIKKMMTIL